MQLLLLLVLVLVPLIKSQCIPVCEGLFECLDDGTCGIVCNGTVNPDCPPGFICVLNRCIATAAPTNAPTGSPTNTPTNAPTAMPVDTPTNAPTESPTSFPTASPTSQPTACPTVVSSCFSYRKS